MKTYIDFDGVILDTVPLLFKEYEDDSTKNDSKKIKHVQKSDWKNVLANAPMIDESIYVLRELDPKYFAILSKIHSLENEGYEKIKYLRLQKIKLEIILVPYSLKKTEVVTAYNNRLIDDSITNCIDWSKEFGISEFFHKDSENFDGWGLENPGFKKVRSLKHLIK